MDSIITKQHARKFLLIKHGLYGAHKFIGKQGVYDYIKQAGCIQYDPIDVCGKNHELVLQSRIKGFSKDMPYALLYDDRQLFDWFDKCQSIMPIEDWPYFDHHRKSANDVSRHKQEVDKVSGDIVQLIKANGPICSLDLTYKEKINWSWAPTSLSRAALETMYRRGELMISHKKNTRRYYDLTAKILPNNLINAPNPNDDDAAIHRWHVLRRIGSVGIVRNKSGDALMEIRGLNAKARAIAIQSLMNEGKVYEIAIEGIKAPYYMKTEDCALLVEAKNAPPSNRLEFIAPLDNLMWDRSMIEDVFGFKYRWEIYTPIKDRQYGYYVLPILYNDALIGRIEVKRDRNKGEIACIGLWWEDASYSTKRMKDKVFKHIESFNSMMY